MNPQLQSNMLEEMQQMYPALVNSVATSITGAIGATDTVFNVLDDSRIPDAPNLLVLGENSALAETVLLNAKNGTQLTVQRGFQGNARAWNAGTTVSRNFTAYDHDAFMANIEALFANAAMLDFLYAADDSAVAAASGQLKDGALIIRAPNALNSQDEEDG